MASADPSCPLSSSPQHTAESMNETPQLCRNPALIDVQCSETSTLRRSSAFASGPASTVDTTMSTRPVRLARTDACKCALNCPCADVSVVVPDVTSIVRGSDDVQLTPAPV